MTLEGDNFDLQTIKKNISMNTNYYTRIILSVISI